MGMVKGKALAVVLALVPVSAQANMKEQRVQDCSCHGMQREVHMPGGGFADCVSDTHVVEIDRTAKWAEAIGQALYYAEQTGKRARVVLFCDDDNLRLCDRHRLRFESTVSFHNLPIELRLMDGSTVAAACGVR